MTDREAIRRLAATVARYAERHGMCQLRSEVMELLESIAEPAAPAVTREHAKSIQWFVEASRNSEVEAMRKSSWPVVRDWPAFFRAVADALEGE